MEKVKFVGSQPEFLGRFDIRFNEFMFVHDMLIREPSRGLRGWNVELPSNVLNARSLINRAYQNMLWSDRRPEDKYVYLSVKRIPTGPGNSFNRPGAHIDGFLTEDHTYIWSDMFATLYSNSSFELTPDHNVSIREMEDQGRSWRTMQEKGLYYIDTQCVHKVQIPGRVCLRTFVKVVFSEREFSLSGCTRNPLLPAPWEWQDRDVTVRADPGGEK